MYHVICLPNLQIDRQEAEFKENERRKALEIANQKLWNQTNKVREIHARMFHSEIDAERLYQLQKKKHLVELEEAEKAEFHKAMLAQIAVRSYFLNFRNLLLNIINL